MKRKSVILISNAARQNLCLSTCTVFSVFTPTKTIESLKKCFTAVKREFKTMRYAMNDAKNNKNHDILFFPRRKSVVGLLFTDLTHSTTYLSTFKVCESFFVSLFIFSFDCFNLLKNLGRCCCRQSCLQSITHTHFKTVDPEKEEGFSPMVHKEKKYKNNSNVLLSWK